MKALTDLWLNSTHRGLWFVLWSHWHQILFFFFFHEWCFLCFYFRLSVDHIRAGLLHILHGGSSIVWHTRHRGHRLHYRQRYTNGHLQITDHTPPAVLSQRSRPRTLIPTQGNRLIWCRLFFSCHLDGDLRRAREGSDDPGLRQRQRANGEADCAHRGIRQRPGDPWTGVWHWNSEFEGVWGENNALIF